MIVGSPTILNLVPGGVMKCVHVNQVNKNIEIQFKIMNGAAPYNLPEGVTCTIRGTKGDAFGYAAEAAVTAGSNVITVTLTEQLTAVAGARNIFELVFVGAADDMKVSTENFILAVERQAMGEDTVISDSDLSYAEQVLDQLQSVGAVNAQVQQNKANIAAEVTRATAAEQTLQQNINSEASARQSADNTLQSNINVEASARATQDNVLQAEIDQLIAPSGSAPSAAEVTNARIGADGTTYDTLGNAIRRQVTDVKSAFEDIAQGIQAYFTQENEYGFFTVTDGAYCTGGSIAYASNYHLYQMTAPKNFTFNCSGEVSDSTHLYICIYSGSISSTNNLAKYSNDGNPNLQPLPITDTTVHAGEILTISYYSTPAVPKYFKISSSLIGAYELKDTLPLTEEMKDDVKGIMPGIMPGIIVKKVNEGVTSLRVFVPNKRNDDYCIYNFRHYYKKWDSVGSATNLVSADCWGNTTVTDKDGNSIAQGNSNFITLVEGETYHTGDGHGNEVALVVKFIADGVELNYDAMNVNDEVKCSSFRIIQKTNIYKLGGGTANDYNYTYPELNANNRPVNRFRHYLNMEFSIGNEVEIDNRLDVLLDNVRFRQCNAAMLQCDYGKFTDVICNNFESTHNVVSASGAVTVATDSTVNLSTANEQVCNSVEMFGDGFYISQIMDCLNRDNEDAYVDFRFYEDRLKAYFNPISTGSSGTLLNRGDYLNVRNIRKIDI